MGLVKDICVGEGLPVVFIKINEGGFIGMIAGGLLEIGEEIHA